MHPLARWLEVKRTQGNLSHRAFAQFLGLVGHVGWFHFVRGQPGGGLAPMIIAALRTYPDEWDTICRLLVEGMTDALPGEAQESDELNEYVA